ncbi:hypothetical protein F4801DRAFT_579826 [Xylaria longipes]|nr:hypothetical protein F4801DRAFT_579826 [Xylaria longipes]RYC58333.1 hypothetical protein CHU98_g7888 [Xylaria longipes]
MFIRTSAALVTAALLAGHAAAKTDIAGCVSSQTVAYGGASWIWYVPGTGEICEFLDCGGGRAPPKTTVPGCAGYEGTATYSPSYLPGFGVTATSTSSSSAETVATESSASVKSSSSESASTSAPVSISTSTSKAASITSPPVTVLTGTATSSAAVESQTGSSSDVTPSSAAGDGTPTNGAALPTAAVKGVFGVMAGLAVGVAML